MVTRYGKDPPPSTIQCFMPSYPPQLRLFPPPSNRGESHYHMSGAQGGGPVMRNMHHQQPPQPTTPPNLQDLKSPATHNMQAPPTHQMPPPHMQQQQQGPQTLYLPIRPGGPPTQFQRGGPTGSNRPPRPNMMQGQSYGPGQHGQVQYQGITGLTQPTQLQVMNFMPPNHGNRFFVQGYPNGAYQYVPMFPQHVVRPQQIANSQIMMPQQQQQQVPPGAVQQPIEQTNANQKRKKKPLAIIHPDDGHNILNEVLYEMKSTQPGSGQSSARETPQLQPTISSAVAIEFATKVASTLEKDTERPGSRNSTNSEIEPPVTNDVPANATHEAVPLAKLEPPPESVVMTAIVPNETPIVEHNIEYAPPRDVPRWGPMMPPMEVDPMCVPPAHLMVIGHEDMMNPVIHQQRGFQGWPQEPQPISAAPVMGPPMGIPNAVAPVHVPPPAVKKPELGTPVVSALTHGPTVDISRDYPALGGQRHGAHHQSPGRKRRPARPDVEQPAERAASPSIVAAAPITVPPPSSTTTTTPVAVPAPVVQPTTVPAPAPQPAVAVNTEVPEPVKNVQQHSSPQPAPVIEEPISKPPVVAQRTTTPTPVAEAKANHPKSKSNKRQQRQEQQRQATPPPPRSVTPAAVVQVAAPVEAVVESAAKPAAIIAPERASSPLPDPVPVPVQVSAPVPAPTLTQLPREPSSVPAPKVSQVVDEQAKQLANMKLQDSTTESLVNEDKREERIVAAMNEENEKLTASNKLANKNDNINLEIKSKSNVQENNNVPNITVVVEPETVVSDTPVIEISKPVLKHPYKDDQWSPLNRDGKKQYGRDFLIALQNEPQSKKRPDNLPELEVLRDMRSGGSMRGPPQSQRSDSGAYMNKSSSLRGSSGGGRDSGHLKRASLLGKQKSQKPMPIQLSLSLNEDVKLREAEAPWKPSRNVDKSDMTEEDKKTEMVYKKVRGVLNRLTPQKFDNLVAQVQALPIDTFERLEGVIDLVFVKAVDEPGFSVTYAKLCTELSKLIVANSENFRTLLIKRCQMEFEKNPDDVLNRDGRMKDIEAEADPEKKKEMSLQLEEDERKIRIKSVGNIRFIGELYKSKMINTNIMFSCIDHLISLNTEESLECMCKLITTIGSKLEIDIVTARETLRDKRNNIEPKDYNKLQNVATMNMNKYFNTLDALVKDKNAKISSRVRFMIQDLIDLREQRWIPRREDSAPKTCDQITKDAEREQLETNLALSASGLDNRRMGGGGGRQDSRNTMDNRNRRGNAQDNNGGWTQVSGNARKQYVETSKLRVNPMDMDLGGNINLGSRNTFIWDKGSASKSDERKMAPVGFGMTQNKYALLEEKPNSRSSSLKGNVPSGADLRDNRDRSSRPSMQDNMRGSRSSQQQSNSREDWREVPSPVDVPTPVTSIVPILDSEAIERSAKTMIEQFVSENDFKEAVATLEETFADSVKREMVLAIFNTSLERSEANRRGASKVLAHFLKIGGLSQDDFVNGLKDFMLQADDLIVDIPRLWDYFAELVADVVAGGFELSLLLDILGPPSKSTLKSLAAIMRLISANQPDSPSLAASVPALRTYLDTEYQSFIKDYQLEFLENAPVVVPKKDDNNIMEKLIGMIRKRDSFESITAWIDKNLGSAADDVAFIKDLTNALLECGTSRKKESWLLEVDHIQRYINLMSRYIDNKPDRELQCLFSIQAKMNQLEHPQGMLCELCQILNDTGVISSDSFKSWKSTKDPRGVEGHGVCMASLTSFFNMIYEDDDDAQPS